MQAIFSRRAIPRSNNGALRVSGTFTDFLADKELSTNASLPFNQVNQHLIKHERVWAIFKNIKFLIKSLRADIISPIKSKRKLSLFVSFSIIFNIRSGVGHDQTKDFLYIISLKKENIILRPNYHILLVFKSSSG